MRVRPASPALPAPLIEPQWLRDRLRDPRLRVVDLREADAYESGHIPGAAIMDLAELGTKVAGCDAMLVSGQAFSALMAGAGISNGDTVIAYDDQWGLAAARLVWGLHHYGHGEAAVLNGGWDRWLDEGGPVGSGEDPVVPGRFEAARRADVSADTAWISRRIESGDLVLVDTRTPAEFAKGHLPGAVSWDWFNAVPPGSWNVSRDPEELREEWRTLGFGPSDEVAVYCGSGMRAAHTYLVLRNAGFTRVRLYDGSWQEWSMTMEGGNGH